MLGILAGVETEYGLFVEGHGAEEQIEDATALIRSYPDEGCFVGWNYRYESPRNDLRGFTLDRLSFDPHDAKFDSGRVRPSDRDLRADRILCSGARLYNDHGHPEFATPECFGLAELAGNDRQGELEVLAAAGAYSAKTGQTVRVYKNNTDFNGASYGTHESYLVPREVGFEALYRAVAPMLVARQILCGAGKVGSENGQPCRFQLTQRADFFSENHNAETLFRRPVFNTRDEPHADPAAWIRLHVIAGDANMLATATSRKVGLVKLAVALAGKGLSPQWDIEKLPEAFRAVSRDASREFPIQLRTGWTTAYDILESYFSAAEQSLELDGESLSLIREGRELLEALTSNSIRVAQSIDWAAKEKVLESVLESLGSDWDDPRLKSFDLEYCNIDRSEGLFYALQSMNEVDTDPVSVEGELSRAALRGHAIRHFKDSLVTACWRSLTFRIEDKAVEMLMRPDQVVDPAILSITDKAEFVQAIGSLGPA